MSKPAAADHTSQPPTTEPLILSPSKDEAPTHDESLLEEVLRHTPYIAAPRFAMPTSWAEVEAMAKRICDAGWCPKSHQVNGKPNQASVELAIVKGMEVKVSPLMAVQGIAIINGVPAIWGDLMLAVITASGLLEYKAESMAGEGPELRAVCRVKRVGRPEPIEQEFSWAMAVRARLSTKPGSWTDYPARMLAMRARSWALRDEFADILCGLASMEELRDSGALARAIAATEHGPRPGSAAAAITAELTGGRARLDDLRGAPADPLAMSISSSSDEAGKMNTGEEPSAVSDQPSANPTQPHPEPVEGRTAHDPDTGEIRDPAQAEAETAPPASKQPAETPAGSTASGKGDPDVGVMRDAVKPWADRVAKDGLTAAAGDLLGPTEAEWMDSAQAMIARIAEADSAADLEVITASGHVKPELARMKTAAPQQHRAVADFIAKKRTELG